MKRSPLLDVQDAISRALEQESEERHREQDAELEQRRAADLDREERQIRAICRLAQSFERLADEIARARIEGVRVHHVK